MNLEEVGAWRDRTARIAAVLCFAVVLAAFDGLFAIFRHPPNLIHLLPGDSTNVNGPLKERITDMGRLTYSGAGPGISLTFEAVHSGFWFGGFMWRGRISASDSAQPGDCAVTVFDRGDGSGKPSTIFLVRVFKTYDDLRVNSKSFLRRGLDWSPWWTATACVFLVVAAFGAVYLLSHRREQLLALEGKAEIYHVARKEDGLEITFALGTRHGIIPGSRMALLNQKGEAVDEVTVKAVSETDATAFLTGSDRLVEPGFMVARI